MQKSQRTVQSGEDQSVAPEVSGPIGRVYNGILGRPEATTELPSNGFVRDQLRDYFERDLQAFDGEWFRGKKLDGVSDGLMEKLDADKDNNVSWAEFATFRDSIVATLAPGFTDGKCIEEAAGARFDGVDTGGGGRRSKDPDGLVTYDELRARIEADLREADRAAGTKTDHIDVIAQAAARLALVAIDRDQASVRDVEDRSLSREEWIGAALELAK